jgi:tRNA pseudouridine55 synthase
MPMRGFLNIDKPSGMTSFDVVRAVRRAVGVNRVGHAGTLDPLATGVLPVAVGGDATRLIDTLVDASKRYIAEITLGAETDTDDAEGEVVGGADATGVAEEQVARALETFVGTQFQMPPAYSAIKRDGVPAYRAARRGETPELEPRQVVAHSLTLARFEGGRCTVEVHCGKGYYVRSLARDLGRALGVYGHVSALRRTAVGPFRIERAVPLDEAVERLQRREVETLLHAPDAVLTGWPAIILGMPEVADVRLGRTVAPVPRFGPVKEGSRVRAYGPEGELVALTKATHDGDWHPFRVFASETHSQ